MGRRENLAKIKELIHDRLAGAKMANELSHFLMTKGLSRRLSDEVTRTIGGEKEWLSVLHASIAKQIKTSPGFDLSHGSKIAAFVGAAGVGKTTVVLKLADFYRSQLKKRVALVTLDQEKGGAYQQMEKYATSWNLPLYTSTKAMDLESDLVLIDTSGCNMYDKTKVDAVVDLFSQIPDLEVHLTLSAASKEVDLYGAIHQFSSLKIASLIFTKFDETLSAGAVVNLSSKVDIPISFVAYGYPLPGTIEIADSKAIAHKILTDLNQEQFQFLRTMAHSSL